MLNGAEAAAGTQGYPERWAWPRARGFSFTDSASYEVQKVLGGGGHAHGCLITIDQKDCILPKMLSKAMIEVSKIMETLNEGDRFVHGSKYIRTGKSDAQVRFSTIPRKHSALLAGGAPL